MQHCTSVSAYVRVYTKCMSVKMGLSVSEAWGQTVFCLWPPCQSFASQSSPLLMDRGFGKAVQVLSCILCHQKASVNSGLYLQGSSLSASEVKELWPLNSTFNNRLTTGRRGKVYILIPKRVQNGVKGAWKVCQMNLIIFWITQKVITCSFTYYKHCFYLPWFHAATNSCFNTAATNYCFHDQLIFPLFFQLFGFPEPKVTSFVRPTALRFRSWD